MIEVESKRKGELKCGMSTYNQNPGYGLSASTSLAASGCQKATIAQKRTQRKEFIGLMADNMSELDQLISFWQDVMSIYDFNRNERLRKRIAETIKYLEELKQLKGE